MDNKYYEELVPVFLPKKADEEASVTVTINGYNYVIQCGKQVEVPRKVALILEQSANQEEEASKLMESLAR